MKTKNLAHFVTRRSLVLAGTLLAVMTSGASYSATLTTTSGNPDASGKVFIDAAKVDANINLIGSIGSQNGSPKVYWVTSESHGLDGKNGFAEIDSKSGGNIKDITFGITGHYFSAVQFSLQGVGSRSNRNFSVKTVFADGTFETLSYKAPNNGNQAYLLQIADGDPLIKSINISAGTSGFDQTKHWGVSGVQADVPAVPLPAAAYLFGSALLGMVGIGYRRNKKQA
ncbi:hypothetical protein HW932_05325 [Allochromatium humboldtianum]|uniref:VPLPA-CTERM sorting domain-containing protein n=1 Tax=Allochromatium humboldtianum TaxID=504901 RepID=A0A850R225_9GAMM|nr:hypothetical protein [Allochromatium humboldtianum]NVZ08679.1 hypothetical protein [Allochromatium humboldtianum]